MEKRIEIGENSLHKAEVCRSMHLDALFASLGRSST